MKNKNLNKNCSEREKNLGLCHKLRFSYPYVFATQCQTLNISSYEFR